jgi:hypothetical protein
MKRLLRTLVAVDLMVVVYGERSNNSTEPLDLLTAIPTTPMRMEDHSCSQSNIGTEGMVAEQIDKVEHPRCDSTYEKLVDSHQMRPPLLVTVFFSLLLHI